MMGADLILSAVLLPTNEDGSLATHEQLRQHALSFINEVTDEKRLDVIEELTGDGYDVEGLDGEDDDAIDFSGGGFELEEGETWRDAVDRRLQEAVTNLFSDYLPRDCTIMQLGGTWWLFSGGTSWGDSFESMADIGALYAIGCFGDGTSNAIRIRIS